MANSGQLPVVHISSLMFAVHAKREAKPCTRQPMRAFTARSLVGQTMPHLATTQRRRLGRHRSRRSACRFTLTQSNESCPVIMTLRTVIETLCLPRIPHNLTAKTVNSPDHWILGAGLVTKDSPLPARLPPKLCRLVGFANLPSLVRMKRPKRAQLVVF